MTILWGNGSDGSYTAGAGATDFGSTNLKQFTTLTIAATRILQANAGFAVYVQQTMTLNGTIKSNQVGSGAGGSIFVYARNSNGTGAIQAFASNTGTPIAPVIEGLTSPAVAANGVSANGGAGAVAGVAYNIDNAASRIRSLLAIGQLSTYIVNGGTGGNGGGNGSAPGSGGGGGSFVNTGGAGGQAGSDGGGGTGDGAGGQGGNAGGLVVLVTVSIVSFSLNAVGSNGQAGSNGSGANGGGGGGGGGGAGGLVVAVCIYFNGSVSLAGGTGGAAGTHFGGGTGSDGVAGNNGNLGRQMTWDVRTML